MLMEGRGISRHGRRRSGGFCGGCADSERGVGLIELLAVIPMLAATLLATYALYNVASKSQVRTDNRAQALIAATDRLRADVPRAAPGDGHHSGFLAGHRRDHVGAPVNQDRSVKRRVRYECATLCQRWEGPENGALTSGPVMRDQQRPEPGRLHDDAELDQSDICRLPSRGQRSRAPRKPIVFDGGFALRNQLGDNPMNFNHEPFTAIRRRRQPSADSR